MQPERSGDDTELDQREGELDKADRILDTDPNGALELAGRHVDDPDHEVAVRAYRIAAFAARETQEITRSTSFFEAALDRMAPNADDRSRTMLSLAGNYAMAGNFEAAHRLLDDIERRADLGEDGHLIDVQRASIYRTEDRLTEAITTLRRLLDTDDLTIDIEAHILFTLGTSLMQLGRVVDGRAALQRALAAYERAGQVRPQLDVVTHLALCEARMQNIPLALERFAEAKQLADRLGVQDGIGLIDMARGLLEAGLGAEAAAAVDTAIDHLDERGGAAWTAEAYLVRALAGLNIGDAAAAERYAAWAKEEFEGQGRPDGAAQATATIWLSVLGADREIDYDAALHAADDLEIQDHRFLAQELRLKVALRAISEGDRRTGGDAAVKAAKWRGDSPTSSLRVTMAEAVTALAGDDRNHAMALLANASDQIDRHRLTLAATELRARATGIGPELLRLGLDAAFEGEDANVIWAWSERLRANTLDLRPDRASASATVLEGLAAVRRAALAMRLGGDRSALAEAERTVVDLLRRSPANVDDGGDVVRDGVRDGVHDQRPLPLPSSSTFLEYQGWLRRIDVDDNGQLELSDPLAPVAEVAGLSATIRTDLLRVIRHRATDDGAAFRHALLADLATLDAILAIPSTGPTRRIVVSDSLHGLPWNAVPSLRSTAVAVAPTASVVDRYPGPIPNGDVVVAVGPALMHGRAEAAAVAGIWSDRAVVVADSVDEVIATMTDRRTAIVHLVAHGQARVDSPIFSSLELADGPLHAVDLERVGSPLPLVILSACDAGVSSVLGGNETLGLVAALLAVGCRSVIAPIVPVVDANIVPVMSELHRRLRTGLGPADALRRTASSFPPNSSERFAADSLVCFGSG